VQLSFSQLNAGWQFLWCADGVPIQAARFPYTRELRYCDRVAFQALQKGRATNGHRVTDLDRIQGAHKLPGTSLAHAEDTLDGVAIEVFSVKPAQMGEDGVKPCMPKGLRRHREAPTPL
jgi:hypothetical protein